MSASEYHTDLGLVLSVAPSVYSEYLRKQKAGAAVEGTVEGTVELFDTPRDFPTADLLRGGLPGIVAERPLVIGIDSPLQVRFRFHSSHPRLTAWSIRRIEHHTKGRGYDFFYTFIENSPEELMLARGLIRDGAAFINVESVVNEFDTTKHLLSEQSMADREDFIRAHLREFRPITEYDSRNSDLDPLVPLTIDPRYDLTSLTHASNVFAEIKTAEDSGILSPYRRHKVCTVPPVFAIRCEDTNLEVKFEPYPSRFLGIQEGCIRIPPGDSMLCPHCGNEIDLDWIRTDIERKTGGRSLDSCLRPSR